MNSNPLWLWSLIAASHCRGCLSRKGAIFYGAQALGPLGYVCVVCAVPGIDDSYGHALLVRVPVALSTSRSTPRKI